MKFTIINILVIFSCLNLLKADSYDGDKDELAVYLCIGQSNMNGYGAITSKYKKSIKGCYLLNKEGTFVKATHPYNQYTTIDGPQRLGPTYTFAKKMMKEKTSKAIGLVVNPRGGSSISQWKKGSKYYKEAIRRTLEAKKHGELKGIIWHQGESDSKNEKYSDDLKQLVKDLRKDLKSPKLPFVAGQIIEKEGSIVNPEIEKAAKKIKYYGFVSSEGLKTFDRWHFDTDSVVKMGERYAEEMIKLLK